MKTQNWIDGTAFVGGLAIAAVIWAGVHDVGGGWSGSDKQFIQAANVALSDGGHEDGGTSQRSGTANDWTAAIEAAPRPYRPLPSLTQTQPDGSASKTPNQSSTTSTAEATEQPIHPDSTTSAETTEQPIHPDSTTSAETTKQPNHLGTTSSTEATKQPNRSSAKVPAKATKHPDRPGFTPSAQAPKLPVRVYLTDSGHVERVMLEQYVRGVLAAEMPADFEPAALQAQALAARTYIVRRLLHEDRTGVPTEKADVTDTQTHQVYRSRAEMDKLRKNDKDAWQAIDQAVSATQGLVIAYEGEPIDALYFSSSNGYTENSEDVFGFALPYLRSVDSPWDRDDAPRALETVTLPLDQFYDKLGIDERSTAGKSGNVAPTIQVRSRTSGRRVETLAIGDTTLSGVQARDKLGLRSADFSWQITDDTITITTRGSGHGVGMSQWGAQGMALAGYTADEIISHYYSGANLVEVSKFL